LGSSWRALLPLLTCISKTTGAPGFGCTAAAAEAAASADCCNCKIEIDAKEPAGKVVPVSTLLNAEMRNLLAGEVLQMT
jgi:hypothetical protein